MAGKLGELSAKHATDVYRQMVDLQIRDLNIPSVQDVLHRIEGKTNVGSYDGLCWLETGGDLTNESIRENDSHYVHGDFHAEVRYPNYEEVRWFVRALPAILDKLATLRAEKDAEVAEMITQLEAD